MSHPFPVTDPPFRPEALPATDPDFPVRITRRAKRGLFSHLVNARPYQGPCLRVFLDDDGDPLVAICDESVLTGSPHLRSRFGRTTVGVPEEEAGALTGCVVDRRSFPPGPPGLFVFTSPERDDPSSYRPGRLRLSLPKLQAVHPELFQPPGLFTKVAHGILSITSAFAESDGKPGWVGRLVGENDPDGQAEAVEAVARVLWTASAEPAVVVSVDPPVVAVHCVGFDQVVLLRAPDSFGLAEGDRLIACNWYEQSEADQPDIIHGSGSFHARNFVWPALADPITDDDARLTALKAEVPAALWKKIAELGAERLANGDRPRDGRPWLSRVPAADQGNVWWRRRGGYLKT